MPPTKVSCGERARPETTPRNDQFQEASAPGRHRRLITRHSEPFRYLPYHGIPFPTHAQILLEAGTLIVRTRDGWPETWRSQRTAREHATQDAGGTESPGRSRICWPQGAITYEARVWIVAVCDGAETCHGAVPPACGSVEPCARWHSRWPMRQGVGHRVSQSRPAK